MIRKNINLITTKKKTFLNFYLQYRKEEIFQKKRNLFFKTGLLKKAFWISEQELEIFWNTVEIINMRSLEQNLVKPQEKIAKQKEIELYESIDQISERKFDVITMWHVLEHVTKFI